MTSHSKLDHQKYYNTFRCSSPANAAGLKEIKRCMSNNEIPSLLDAVHISGRENCSDPDIPPIALEKSPSPLLLFPILESIRFSSKGQGVCALTTCIIIQNSSLNTVTEVN